MPRAAAQKQASLLEAQRHATQSSDDYGSDTTAQGSVVWKHRSTAAPSKSTPARRSFLCSQLTGRDDGKRQRELEAQQHDDEQLGPREGEGRVAQIPAWQPGWKDVRPSIVKDSYLSDLHCAGEPQQ